eukprot:TRINITY_DN6329_c0_g1_i1.p1 TRINITY_DN6329_c0_g1~~TRINITY_DN6329_c0_g1_i1.p1  ORF type:complete len:924 (-),score=257.66 TRINITY_DN6329_c0_g1_i1:25-2763(-)
MKVLAIASLLAIFALVLAESASSDPANRFGEGRIFYSKKQNKVYDLTKFQSQVVKTWIESELYQGVPEGYNKVKTYWKPDGDFRNTEVDGYSYGSTESPDHPVSSLTLVNGQQYRFSLGDRLLATDYSGGDGITIIMKNNNADSCNKEGYLKVHLICQSVAPASLVLQKISANNAPTCQGEFKVETACGSNWVSNECPSSNSFCREPEYIDYSATPTKFSLSGFADYLATFEGKKQLSLPIHSINSEKRNLDGVEIFWAPNQGLQTPFTTPNPLYSFGLIEASNSDFPVGTLSSAQITKGDNNGAAVYTVSYQSDSYCTSYKDGEDYEWKFEFVCDSGQSTEPYLSVKPSQIGQDAQRTCGATFQVNTNCDSFIKSAPIGCDPASSTACGNGDNKGQCVALYNPTRTACDCYSGYGGANCATSHIGSAIPTKVEVGSLSFEPKLSLTAGSDVVMVVNIPLTENEGNKVGDSYSTTTFLTFGGGKDTKCNYPSPKDSDWETTAVTDESVVYDSYKRTFSYADLVACGLAKKEDASGFQFFNNSLSIERNFQIVKGSFHVPRKMVIDEKFSIAFPSVIHPTSSITVTTPQDNYNFLATVIKTSYSPTSGTNGEWTIRMGTIVDGDYKLDVGSNAYAKPTGDEWKDRSWNVGSLIADECGATGNCFQHIDITISHCDLIALSKYKMNFDVVCRSGTTCATAVPAKIKAEVTLTTTTACPVVSEFEIQNLNLDTFDSATFDPLSPVNTKTTFSTTDNILFQVRFDDPPANIDNSGQDGVTVAAICAYAPPTKAPVPGEKTPPCDPTKSLTVGASGKEATTKTASGTYKTAVEANAGDLKAKSGVTGDNLVVQVDVAIKYKGDFATKKRSVVSHHFSGQAAIKLLEKMSVKKENDPSSASVISFSLMIVISITLLFI